MKNKILAQSLWDFIEAVEAIMLGGVQAHVIEEGGKAMINSWNDHNEDKIHCIDELYNWEHRHSNEKSSIIRDTGACQCGEDH